MSQEEDVMSIIHLLAAAAEAGAKGVLSQAAFNLLKATEAKQKAIAIKNNPDFLVRATTLVEDTKRDIILFNITADTVNSDSPKTIN